MHSNQLTHPLLLISSHVSNFTTFLLKADSHCTRLRLEVPINQWCHLHSIKSRNRFNFYVASMVYIGLLVAGAELELNTWGGT